MQKFYSSLFVLMLMLSAPAWAQTDYTLYSIGFIGGQKIPPVGNSYGYSSGHVSSTPGYVTIVPNESMILSGFPYNILYFKNVFDKPMFVSTGYYADYVQLQWNVVFLGNSIKRFKIFRKPLGDPGDSLVVASLSSDNYSWKDEFAEKGVLYEYTLFAEGLADKLRLPFVNIMQGVGFALPTGRASGRVTFEGGTAVEGVSVLAETDGSLSGRSLYLNGTNSFFTIPHLVDDKELEIRTGFTFQAWCKWDGTTNGVIFSKGNQYDLSIQSNKISFKVNNVTVDLPFTQPVDTFFHVSAVYKPGSHLALYVHLNDNTKVDSAKISAGTQPVAALDNILIGKNIAGNFYKGNVDEMRLWGRALTYKEINGNFSRYINGTEADLAGYWRLNEGVGSRFYDFSRKGFTFHENHAFIANGVWSTLTPLRSQLAFKGVTDPSGNYLISGFPYETDGSLYKFTPTLGAHSFDPNQQVRLISNETSTINELNFKDISSFEVTGTVKYRNTNFPVEGVSILVDGKPATGSDSRLIVSDNFGRFSLHVPIGKHSLRLGLASHVFESEGRFPVPEPGIPVPLFDFQQPISGLEFLDSTLVKVAGRVVGGPVEAAKPLGFGNSKNNLGTAVINLTSEKGFDIALSDSTKNYTEEHIVNSANFKTKNVKVFPDVNTGEFVAYLIPEKFKVTGITAGSYIFDPNFNITINLKESILQNELLKDTLGLTANGVVVQYPPYNPAKYDTIFNSADGTNTWKIGVDTFYYQKKQNFIYRTNPTLNVTNVNGQQLFGDQSLVYEDRILKITETIPLIQNGQYTFGHPVFNDRQSYNMYIELFEEYTNGITGILSKVPVSDGKLEVVNNLAINSGKETLNLNSRGKVVYHFTGGLPEINKDNITPANSYTKTINITAFSGNNGSIQTIWMQNNPFRAFLFGGMPVGNNFVTTGPTQVITILRDPPGSSSKAYLEQGQTKGTITKWSLENTFSQEANVKFKLGAKVKIFAGIGVGTITETEYDNDVTIGWNSEERWLSDNEKTHNVTSTKRWETSDNSSFVGDKADVFVGNASNIVYGISKIVDIIPKTSCINCIPGTYSGGGRIYSIGLKDGIRINPEVTTGFMHTQGHIEDVIIPNLKKLRNSFLVYSPDPSSVPPKVVTSPSDDECTKNAIYISKIPITDPLFGSPNEDTVKWGSLAVRSSVNVGNGPSYKIIMATGCANFYTKDTVHYFNQQVKDWLFWLEKNEKEKINATRESENLAFDAGATFEKSVTVDSSETSTQTFEWFVNPSLAGQMGFDFNGFGLEISGKLAYGHTSSDQTGSVSSGSTTYGYTLAESEATDYYSVNVRKPNDGFGPVFRINGGVTSCPYQGEYKTKYYKPGGKSVILSPATVQVDAPLVDVEQAVATDVASNRPAEFTLLLKNNSGIEADRWYTLKVDDTTNPYGAVIEIDGAPIANGRTFLVKAGQILQKNMKVRMGRPDIMKYEDLRLILSSQCDDGIQDDVTVSAFFIPGCSDILLEIPKDHWVMNTNNTPVDSLLVKLSAYNRDYDNFKQILFQYKPSGSSLWTTDMVFFNPGKVTTAEYDAAQDPKQWITGPAILYYWDMHSQPDRNYDIRAKTVCELGPATFTETPTDIISGIKDVKRPVVFGSPQPADGVLSAGDEISLQFDETIEASLLTPFNFSVQAVLNGYQLNHNTSVEFDGVNDQVKMGEGLNLSRSFTIEFWTKRNLVGKRQVVFSKGTENNDLIEIGFTSGNQLFVKLGQQEITTSKTFPETDWYHYAVSYDATGKKLSAYRNDLFILENVVVNGTFSGAGAISLGQSLFSGSDLYQGNLHDLRIWSKALQLGDVYAKMSQSMSGNEIGLVGYWPFDEANGVLAHDKARFRNATLNAEWLVLPKGRAYGFDGVDDYVKLNTGGTVIVTDEMDFTVEFWFRGAAGQKNVTMFSSGKGDGTDKYNGGSWSIGFNNLSQLEVASKGIFLTVDNGVNLLDDSWHHFASSVSRKGNTNIFIDGELVKSQTSTGLGPLYGASMWLGARGFKIGTLTTLFDQYFNGAIDEFRAWNLSKKQNQLSLAKNAKLNGDELGLTAYYPFEFYTTSSGIKVINPTLADQWQNPYGPNGGTATAVGGATYSLLTPNIKDARPLQKVNFDWAVNGDKIVITPSASMAAAIEKTLLEITVSGVEDKFENRIASPVSWTAFIDRNQLKWGDDQMTMEKILYQPLEFKVDIVNKGGTQQNFVINNLPSWLTADPQSGIISALSSMQITFKVDEGLNTGTFQEDIYLKSDFGFDEKLIISIRNYTPVPSDWKVNPLNFQYSMNIDGQIKMNGKISNNPFDYIAVFVDNQCRGVAHLEYVAPFDNYQSFLTIYSNQLGGEDLVFKLWNANEGQVYTNVTPAFSFVSNAVHGTPSSPVLFESIGNLMENKVELPQGWKWVSFNLSSDNMKQVDKIVKTNGSEGDQLKSKLFYDTYSATQGWIGTITSNGGLKNEETYKAYMKDARSFLYSGTFPDPATLPVTIEPGWNWIGYISRFNMNVNEALASFHATAGDLVKGQHNFATYEPAMGWIGNLTFLKPGEGYMYKAQASGKIVYPKITSLSNGRISRDEDPDPSDNKVWKIDPYAYMDNMNTIAEVIPENENRVEENDLLGAFEEGVCRGVAKPVFNPLTNKYSFFITVYGNEHTGNIRFIYYRSSDGNQYSIRESLLYQSNTLRGANRYPVVLNVEGLAGNGVTSYPNPFIKDIGIDVKVSKDAKLKVEIADVTGRKVKDLEETHIAAGTSNLKWDGKDNGGNAVSSGVYIMMVTINGELRSYRIIKH